ncbi:MAG: ATP-binding protein [Mesorhizobium sp.]|nr:ATP-binding protein [Mesorhizobium sp.]
MLHDAGMCLAAYPQGVSEIIEHPAWRPILRQIASDPDTPSKAEFDACIVEFIRRQHANQAQNLPNIEWVAPDGASRRLIEDGDIRQKFGNFIGTVAKSHWWSVDKIAADLNLVIPAPPPFPMNWSLDLLKVAAILRVADAAHIDERRAPQFLWSLYGNRLNEESKQHWLFQSRLTQPERRNDALHYSSTKPFDIDDVNAWWVAYDALNMINSELRSVDVMLADLRGDENRLATRRVANCETPTTLMKSIQVQGWVPIDTSLRIGDIPNLISKLGGDALYGEQPLVPLRELIQNAGDALRLRKALQAELPASSAPIIVEIGEQDGNTFLQVSDTGIGMDAEIIQQQLLNFGQSGWRHDPILRDYAAKISNIPNVSGKFGIGFFAIFMLGQKVEILTRRFDRGFHDTLSLHFRNGLASRPILSPAPQDSWLMNGGTTIRVWLDDPTALLGRHGIDGNHQSLHSVCCSMFPAFEFPILVRWNDEEALVDGTAWSSEPPHQLISRINSGKGVPGSVAAYAENLRPLHYADGSLAGRMALIPRDVNRSSHVYYELGLIAVNGAASTRMSGFLGIVDGHPLRAARDIALPNISPRELTAWLAEQAALVKNMHIGPELENDVAEIICTFGGDPGPLVTCITSEGWLRLDELREYLSKREKLALVSMTSLNIKERDGAIDLEPDVIFVESGIPGIFQDRRGATPSSQIWNYFENRPRSIEDAIVEIISDCWKIDLDFLQSYNRETIDGAYGKYDVEIQIGRRNDEKITEFAHVFTRDLCPGDLVSIANRAVEDRARTGDYERYFGSGSWRVGQAVRD